MLSLKHSCLKSRWKHAKLLCRLINTAVKTEPVLGKEVIQYIQPTKNAVVVDMTFGTGGHTELLLKSDSSLKVIALDRDPASYAKAQELAVKYPDRLIPLLGKFSDFPSLIQPLGYAKESIDAILFDCGCSVLQMETAERGFSPKLNGYLDMRMDGHDSNDGLTAHEVLRSANEIDLKNIFKLYGDLSSGKKISQAVLLSRHTKAAVKSTTDLAELLVSQCDLSYQEVCSAFKSLRCFINDEFNEISHGILLAEWYLKVGGRLLTISEDKLDDSIIKNHFAGTHSENFVGLPMGFSSMTAPSDTDVVIKKSCWTKLNKHVIIPENERLLAKARKFRAVLKQ